MSENKNNINLEFTEKVSEEKYITFLVWCGIHWGRGKTLGEAITAAKVCLEKVDFSAFMFTSKHPIEAWVDDSGGWHIEHDGKDFEGTNLGEIKIEFEEDEDRVYRLKDWLCAEIQKTEKGMGSYQLEENMDRTLRPYYSKETNKAIF